MDRSIGTGRRFGGKKMMLVGSICIVLICICAALGIKIFLMRKAADEIRCQMKERLTEDTNVGIDISSGDKKMRALAEDLDRQVKYLRKERLRYELGDTELKTAVTNIPHDLRTPLTALSGYMQFLDREEVSPEVREALDIMKNRIRAMTKLTEELFQYSVIVSAEKYQEREKVDIGEVLAESLAGFYAVLKEKGIEPFISMPEEAVVKIANRDALLRVFGNIINNAVKYSDGDLRIVLHKDGNLQFANHASKLDEVEAGKLFERFYTVENGRESTGLGLSIAKTLCERMGISIHAKKEKEWFIIEMGWRIFGLKTGE